MLPHNATLLDQPGTVLIDDRLPGRRGGTSYLLCDPVDTIVAHQPGDVPPALERLDQALRSGRFVAGYLAYDAGLGLDKPLRSRHRAAVPLVWLGVYDACQTLDAGQIDLGPPGEPSAVENLHLNIDQDAYLAAVARAKQYIAAGDVYQVNYTGKLRFDHAGSPRSLWSRLRAAHPVDHSAWINTGPRQIISLSPELFLRRQGDELLTRPMKGTAHRGRWFEEDQALASHLPRDEKNRAENVMIVDLMRNDLGRVCRLGSIQVARALHVECYRSLFQMTSDVRGRLRTGVSASHLLRATFPPGSVTGAPKLRAMEIIDELEQEARGVYCGTIGLFRPGGDCLLNVAIRTIVQEGRQCEMGVGSGIVADSDPRAEWAEIWLKGQFLAAVRPDFELLETMLLPRGGPPAFAAEHLQRMRRSAEFFGWEFPDARLRQTLQRVTTASAGDRRLRLLLAEDGQCRAEVSPCEPPPELVKVLLAARRIDPAEVFVYHKTTRRAAYDAEWRDARRRGYFDLVYRNLQEEITEGAISNLLVQIDGRWYTPPLRCGLLPGIWRADRLARGDVEERVLALDDLLRATRIVMGNSVRGPAEVELLVAPASDAPIWRRCGLPSPAGSGLG